MSAPQPNGCGCRLIVANKRLMYWSSVASGVSFRVVQVLSLRIDQLMSLPTLPCR